MSDASTPLMRQYNGIKQQVPNALLMFRLGDFYELFFEDAVVAARELEITLTARNKEKGTAIPMCGVPFHASEGYISRLIQKGYRVAICDQVEDPKVAKGLVRREIMRVVTPGTAMDSNLVRSRENNFLAAVARIGARSAVAHVDVSTGEFKVTDMDAAEVAGALEHLGAREVVTVIGNETVQWEIDLPDQHPMVEPVNHPPHLGDDLMHFRLVGGVLRQDFLVRWPAFDETRIGRIVAKLAVLDQMPDHIDPEAIDTPAQPEAHDIVDRLAHFRVAPIQVRLLAEKGMVIILTRRLVILPGAAAKF